MMTHTVDPTQELAAFLRNRRERLDPRDLGLPSRRRARRTPGLRREEVAELAGVSVDYIVRLEQGRGVRPSADVVEALARALRLAPAERAYLFDLAQQRPRGAGRPATTAAPSLARLVADLSPLPAMLLCLMHPEIREFYVDRERVVREGIAHLRAAWAAHPEDRALTDLIAEFITRDEDFARGWAERDIRVSGRGHKMMRHPDVGVITVRFEVLMPLQDPDQRLLIFRAADDESQSALDRLCTR